ncbi:baculoviral IAP repeat-containing protein 7-like [Mercenaria mercenaria]|uniref:baculoviral IAP repeat-containing protein 7-like n=1 Tax=Mercenaria mercenaria TaxID=6596 RepID=UPI00234EBB7C|nr:baculoviral IAP repeat-containing protein 7-like [Mercenaria mercenaria]
MSENCSDIVVSQQHAARPPPIALGINVEKPKFPQYAVYAKRMESFDAWPEYLPVKKDDLVEAGLVYTGVGDSVRCYFCGGGLRNWEQDDVPMEEHAKWYPKCPHILLVKGQAYVEKLGRGEKPEEDNSSVQTDSARAGPNYLESVAAQSCIQMDYSKDMVQKAINKFIDRYGNGDFKAKDLCEILFELEEEPTESSCVSDNVVDSRRHIPTLDEELESGDIQTPEEIESLKEENQRLKENQICKICLDNRADVIFLPCGHMVSCPQCAPALLKCPICRQTVNGHIKAFFAVTSSVS